MKKILLVLGLFFLVFSFCYAKDVSVKGYLRKDGTYVAPYHRSSPDSTVRNNYDYKGNTNPYTGEEGDNYYRNNPTSEYYGTSSSTQLPNYNYRNNDRDDSTYSSPSPSSLPSLPSLLSLPSLYGDSHSNSNSSGYYKQQNSSQDDYDNTDTSSSEDSDSEE